MYNTNYNDGVGSTHGTNAVGSISDEKTDNIYFMFASNPKNEVGSYHYTAPTSQVKFIDSIIEQNADGTITPVLIDHWCTIDMASDFFVADSYPNDDQNILFPVQSLDGVRVGMTIDFVQDNEEIYRTSRIINIIPA